MKEIPQPKNIETEDDGSQDGQPRPRPDSTADVEGAAMSASPELAAEIRLRQKAIADKRRRAAGNTALLQRRIV